MNIAMWVVLAVVVFVAVMAVILGWRKGKWYKVYLANPEMSELHVYRSGWDRFWRSDEAGIMMFHTEDGKSVRIGKHWIIKIVED